MKRIVMLISCLMCLTAIAQSVPTESYDNPGEQTEQQTVTPSTDEMRSLEDLFHYSGSLTELGGRRKNQSVVVGTIGAVIGGVLTGVGIGIGSQPLYIVGGVAALGFGIAAFVLNVRGNYFIREGGKVLRDVQVSGSGITVKF